MATTDLITAMIKPEWRKTILPVAITTPTSPHQNTSLSPADMCHNKPIEELAMPEGPCDSSSIPDPEQKIHHFPPVKHRSRSSIDKLMMPAPLDNPFEESAHCQERTYGMKRYLLEGDPRIEYYKDIPCVEESGLTIMEQIIYETDDCPGLREAMIEAADRELDRIEAAEAAESQAEDETLGGAKDELLEVVVEDEMFEVEEDETLEDAVVAESEPEDEMVDDEEAAEDEAEDEMGWEEEQSEPQPTLVYPKTKLTAQGLLVIDEDGDKMIDMIG